MTQAELIVVCDQNLMKDKAELPALRLKQKHLLAKGVAVTHYRSQSDNLTAFFTAHGSLCYCHDIDGLSSSLSQERFLAQCHLFIDSSQRSLWKSQTKCPKCHSVHLKKSYDYMKTLLESVAYKTHQWNICCYLKVIGILVGMEGGFTKFCRFLWLWDSWSTAEHYVKPNWQPQDAYEPWKTSVKFLLLGQT